MKNRLKNQTLLIATVAIVIGLNAFTSEHSVQSEEIKIRLVNSDQDTVKTPTAESNVKDGDEVFEIVEEMPQYPGGEEAMIKFISQNFHYPDSAKKNKISGRILITFIVDTDGSILDAKPVLPKNRQLGYGLEEEGIRVISNMPNWTPGKQRGKPVKVKMILPIQCELKR